MAGDVEAHPERGVVPEASWQALVRRHFMVKLKRPFNTEARDKAGLPAGFYEGLADEAQIEVGSRSS
ncbi:MAG: hypothetical protein WCC64_18760 [Aliidongia sp.]